MAALHATELLTSPEKADAQPTIVLYGAERYLKLECLKRIPALSDDDAEITRMAGKDADLREVLDELSTVSMFGDRRVVLIDDADEFVSRHRAGLEAWFEKPGGGALLVLDVQKWQKTTRLAKLLPKTGMAVECSELKGAALRKWLQTVAASEFDKKLTADAANLMTELAGSGLGVLCQEVAKLSDFCGDRKEITSDDVTTIVGGWRLETTWHMLDAVRDGKPGLAVAELRKLLVSGEPPQKILGGVVFVFRKFAMATEEAKNRTPLAQALKAAGVFPAAVGAGEAYLRRMGYGRASRIMEWLAEADHAMKGGSRTDPSLLLEQLFVRLSGVA